MATKLVSIRIPEDMLLSLRTLAPMRGDIGYQQLMKTYIADGIYRDNPQLSGPISNTEDPSGGQVNVLSPLYPSAYQPGRPFFAPRSVAFSSGDQLTTGGAYHHNIIFVEK